MLHQIKAPQFYTDLDRPNPVLNPSVNGKIQELFKAFECFSSTFQGIFNIKGLFKPVRTLITIGQHLSNLYITDQEFFGVLRGQNLAPFPMEFR